MVGLGVMAELAYTKVRKALIQSLIDIKLTLEIVPEGILDKAPNHPWCLFDFIPVDPVAVTLGPNGEDEHRGIFMIRLQYPSNEGTGEIYNTADNVCDYYKIGSSYIYSNQLVIVTSCGQSSIVKSFHGFSLTLNVNWLTRIPRS